MNLEAHARQLSSYWQHHSTRGYPEAHIGKIWQILVPAGDAGQEPTVEELKQIATQLENLEDLIDKQMVRLRRITGYVRNFAEAVNDTLADTERPPAPETYAWTGIDEATIDRLAEFYNDKGHRIR